MKKVFFTSILFLMIGLLSKAQVTRYFEFHHSCGQGNWQDTSFIASTTNQIVIDSVLANITKPETSRKFINGRIDYGHGGHNHNAHHWFLWHFIPDQWDINEVAIELCDGCPYSAVDADTAYWIGNVGHFCPWSGFPVREVSKPLGINDHVFENEIFLYPNPAKETLTLKWNSMQNSTVVVFNLIGEELLTGSLTEENKILDINNLLNGIYFIKIIEGNRTAIKKLIVDGK